MENFELKMAKIARGVDPYAPGEESSSVMDGYEAKTDIGKLLIVFLLAQRLMCIIDRKISTSEGRHPGYKASPNQALRQTRQAAPCPNT